MRIYHKTTSLVFLCVALGAMKKSPSLSTCSESTVCPSSVGSRSTRSRASGSDGRSPLLDDIAEDPDEHRSASQSPPRVRAQPRQGTAHGERHHKEALKQQKAPVYQAPPTPPEMPQPLIKEDHDKLILAANLAAVHWEKLKDEAGFPADEKLHLTCDAAARRIRRLADKYDHHEAHALRQTIDHALAHMLDRTRDWSPMGTRVRAGMHQYNNDIAKISALRANYRTFLGLWAPTPEDIENQNWQISVPTAQQLSKKAPVAVR